MSTEGDYEMYSSRDGSVEVHVRQALLQNNPMTVNSRVAVLANGVDVVKINCADKDQITVNDRPAKTIGTTTFSNGGAIYTNRNSFSIQAANGDTIRGYIAGSRPRCWINVFIYSKETNGAGFCFADNHDRAIERRVVGLFSAPKLPRATSNAIAREQKRELRRINARVRRAAQQACSILGISKPQKDRCVKEWSLATPNMRRAIIQGYERLIDRKSVV